MDGFLTFISWGLGIPATILFLVAVIASIEDHLDGKKIAGKYPIYRFYIIAVVCWAWIFNH